MVRPLYSGPRWRVRSAAHLEDAIQRYLGAWNAHEGLGLDTS
jgi:hypothetical protein